MELKYRIQYSCISDVGKCRRTNQDNFICGKTYMEPEGKDVLFPITGEADGKKGLLLGVFDGMGGEECGEAAAWIAACRASELVIKRDAPSALRRYCLDANEEICRYTEEHNLFSMGTTAALLAFTRDKITLCNIGDSKIFCFADDKLEQISEDHVGIAIYGHKPPLSQNLGIPPTELHIEPYIVSKDYRHGETYLICSDGLTDMVEEAEIETMMQQKSFDELPSLLLETALSHGGKDNITLILCRIEKKKNWLFR